MPLLTDALRPLWMKNINEVTYGPKTGIADWIRTEKFQVFNPIQDRGLFDIDVDEGSNLTQAFAFEADKFASASFESLNACAPLFYSTKGSAWTLIKAYYSAFYAAHSLLRLFGKSCSQISAQEAAAILRVASAWNSSNLSPYSKYYLLEYVKATKKLSFSVDDKANGSHLFMWGKFLGLLDSWLAHLALRGTSTGFQPVIVALGVLRDNLTDGGSRNGAWLSFIRNSVSYQHQFGAWFPFQNVKRDYSRKLIRELTIKNDALTVNLSNSEPDQLKKMATTCSFIVSMLHENILDMSKRCPKGTSFHINGSLRLLELISNA